MTVGSMFAGIGGLDLGFERTGFDVRWQCESDSYCRDVLARHWPGVHCYPDARMSPAQWRQVEPVDVIIGGFPCQDVSNAGLRRGLSGDRSGLWWCIRRAARLLRPKYLVVENVPGLFARGFDTVLGSLARLGYDAEWQVLRASDVGAPHRRARIFIVAYPERAERGTLYPRGHLHVDRQETPSGSPTRGSALADPADDGRRECSASHNDDRRESRGHDVDGRDPAMADASVGGLGEQWSPAWARDVGHADGRHQGPRAGALPDPRGPRLPEPEPVTLRGAGRRHEGRAVEQLRSADWPARPGEPQHNWEPARCIRSTRAQSALGAGADGVSHDLAGWRRAALQATGNAVVPQCAEVIAARVLSLQHGST